MPKIRFLLRSDKPMFHAIPKPLRRALGLSLLAYVGACASLAFTQRQALFLPMKPPATKPAALAWTSEGDARFWVAQANAELGAQSAPCAKLTGGQRPAVAYFGGNAEAPSDGIVGARAAFPGCAVYALAYPGFEGAPGRSSETAIHAAADAMVQRMVRDGFSRENIIMAGRSLGAGVAVRQASLGACLGVYAATPYDSLAAATGRLFPWAPVSLLMLDPFDAIPWAKKAQCPAAFLVADQDQTIPPDHAYALAQAWNPSQPTQMALASGDHGIAFDYPAGVGAYAEINQRVRNSRQKQTAVP